VRFADQWVARVPRHSGMELLAEQGTLDWALTKNSSGEGAKQAVTGVKGAFATA